MLRLTRAQVREIDRRSIVDYKIPGVVLMETAARGVADNACDMLGGDCIGEILILCGGGNNGGDGLAAARHLHNRGADVSILLTADASHYKNEALMNWNIIRKMHLPAATIDALKLEDETPTLIIDAIFG